MSDMHLLGEIRTGIINYDSMGRIDQGHTQPLIAQQILGEIAQCRLAETEVDETGAGHGDTLKDRILAQLLSDGLSNVTRATA
jgi:hypothetical protein